MEVIFAWCVVGFLLVCACVPLVQDARRRHSAQRQRAPEPPRIITLTVTHALAYVPGDLLVISGAGWNETVRVTAYGEHPGQLIIEPYVHEGSSQ